MEGVRITTEIDRSALKEILDRRDGWNTNKKRLRINRRARNVHPSGLIQCGDKFPVADSYVHCGGEAEGQRMKVLDWSLYTPQQTRRSSGDQ